MTSKEKEKKCDEPPPAKKARLNKDCESKQQSNKENTNPENLIWVDCEMTGLNSKIHHICEIAVLITDKDLNIIAEGPDIVINLSQDILSNMSEWCVDHHGKSGLTQQIKDSKITMKQAETQILKFIQQYVPNNTAPLCGNSVHAD
eukprot:750342_1